jgi:hypothetical protein
MAYPSDQGIVEFRSAVDRSNNPRYLHASLHWVEHAALFTRSPINWLMQLRTQACASACASLDRHFAG